MAFLLGLTAVLWVIAVALVVWVRKSSSSGRLILGLLTSLAIVAIWQRSLQAVVGNWTILVVPILIVTAFWLGLYIGRLLREAATKHTAKSQAPDIERIP